MNSDRPNLEDELFKNEWFLIKVRENKSYAQNLYSALCNMQWQKLDVIPILKSELWSCSWRYAGGIVAEIRGGGEDYMDWYCSGMGGFAAFDDDDPDKIDREFQARGYVPEGVVTEEIKEDLNKLGWVPVPYSKDN